MKYLKKFEAQHVSTIAKKQLSKEFAKINSKLSRITDYIKDILLPLSDDGYEVTVNVNTNITDNHISISISNTKYFDLEDIQGVLLHLDKYLKSQHIVSQLPHLIKYSTRSSYGVKKNTYMDRETGQPYDSYMFFCRFYPEKLMDIRSKIDDIRNVSLRPPR